MNYIIEDTKPNFVLFLSSILKNQATGISIPDLTATEEIINGKCLIFVRNFCKNIYS